MPSSTEQPEQTITNLVRSKAVLAPNTDNLGVRTRIDRPRDVADSEPLVIRPFMSGALSSASVFGEGA